MHAELLKLICVVSTFWTPKKVQVYKYISCLLLFLGFLGRLLSRITFTLGDGSVLDKWNKSTSTAVSALIQVCGLVQGTYMTLLMKSICNLKDENSRNNLDKYWRRSYCCLAYFIIANSLASLLYIGGVLVRGPAGSANYYIYSALAAFAITMISHQIIALSFLFEFIKAMKFGPDSQRRKTNPSKQITT
ncbi:hypothetical protein HDV02_005007 [Globomyces sp. JEL0801]|nr:hypothetical protein HDV02_005007 [Globomyces sp. JEL0801]